MTRVRVSLTDEPVIHTDEPMSREFAAFILAFSEYFRGGNDSVFCRVRELVAEGVSFEEAYRRVTGGVE